MGDSADPCSTRAKHTTIKRCDRMGVRVSPCSTHRAADAGDVELASAVLAEGVRAVDDDGDAWRRVRPHCRRRKREAPILF